MLAPPFILTSSLPSMHNCSRGGGVSPDGALAVVMDIMEKRRFGIGKCSVASGHGPCLQLHSTFSPKGCIDHELEKTEREKKVQNKKCSFLIPSLYARI